MPLTITLSKQQVFLLANFFPYHVLLVVGYEPLTSGSVDECSTTAQMPLFFSLNIFCLQMFGLISGRAIIS